MTRPRLLDLFAGAGGCAVGYHRAGFDVTGVDNEPHPDYPFELVQADALAVLRNGGSGWSRGGRFVALRDFDVIHASPPCPRYSTMTGPRRDEHPDLIPVVRDLLTAWGGTYIIENVEGARRVMRHPVKLCGSSFGLRVRRHRYFESNGPLLWSMPCDHTAQGNPVGVYGDHPDSKLYLRGNGTRRGAKAVSIEDAQDALGIDWITTWDDLADAIPPAFTEFLGSQLLEHLSVVAA